ncbi:bile acid:sodium symporter family protein [Fredinandcohnia quinoae]|uniref:Bile acid:sodium symporter family protein n=1 Tax=Fredinandcohnia quinoae TaxID=2918902 RepID=A0AAW5E3R8_9BACI|nr:bile acid:sodium symporter family protein [Fredinandcohnia sp. SECRCQ15]MCH1623996.1 bile acid:sodium symporter family protein [Fredinandcohnia sp. SECRCQ15]
MLNKMNKYLEKMMPLITPTSVIIGVLLSAYLSPFSNLVPWIFAFMTFAGALSSNFKSLQRAISQPIPILVALFTLHLLMPAWAWIVGHITFPDDSLTITGLLLAVVIPTGITSFIWVSMKHGNIALTLSIILVDTMLSPFIVPYSLTFFVGGNVEMDIWSIMKGLFLMIVLPSMLGMVVNHLTKGKSKELLSPRLSPFSKLGLAAVVMINSAEVAPFLKEVDLKLISIAAVVFMIAFSGYLFSWGIGKLFKLEIEVIVALIFTGGMRNISAGAVIAVTFFPSEVAVPVVVGMLFQQVLASLYGFFIDRTYQLGSVQHKHMA